MKSIEYDLRYIDAGMDALEGYLLSDEVFWPLGVNPPPGEPEYPQLTLDWILLTRRRLEGRQLTHDRQYRVEQVISDLDAVRSKWRVAWEKKANQCYHIRLRMWGDFLNDYQENPQEHADRYAYEVRLRAMLEILRGEIREPKMAEEDLLRGLDGYLKSVLVSGDFIWEKEVQAGFEPEKYWFLFGKLEPTARSIR